MPGKQDPAREFGEGSGTERVTPTEHLFTRKDMLKKLERVYFSTIAVRLGAAIQMETSIDQVNILVCGWNNRRERKGLGRINFAQRIKDENEWRATRGLPPDYERFMFVDELELFSRYAGYDLTR